MRPDPVQLPEGAQQIRHGQLQGDEAGDPQLWDLRIANLAGAIAGGDLEASWQLGVLAIRGVLKGERDISQG